MSSNTATREHQIETPRRGAKVLAFAIGFAVAIGPYLLLRPRLATFLGTSHVVSVADHSGQR